MRLLICTYHDGVIETKLKKQYITRLGKGVDDNGYINDFSMRDNLNSFANFVDIAKKQRVDKFFVIGTSVLRDAKNREEFLAKAKERTDIDIDIVSGKKEAELGLYGALGGMQEQESVLLIDIGGGSTEYIVGSQENGILHSASIDVGALRLTEKFISSIQDPIPSEELEAIFAYTKEQLRTIFEEISSTRFLKVIGIGGTITTISAMIQQLREYDFNKVHGSIIDKKSIIRIMIDLAKSDLEKRKKTAGLQVKRADIIIAGILILLATMDVFQIDEITVSDTDNLEGMIYASKPISQSR